MLWKLIDSSLLATEIVNRIEKREWTASQVVDAYIARAALAHQRTNCLTEGKHYTFFCVFIRQSCAAVLFDQARKEAEVLDQNFAQTKKLKGSLHGVPFSFKDQCARVDLLGLIISHMPRKTT